MDTLEMLKHHYHDESSDDWNDIKGIITSDPAIMDGLPIFSGTRIPVYIVLDYLAEGNSIPDIIKEYPSLNEDKIKAALKFAEMLSSLH